MATPSVPGAGGTIISYPNTFNNAANQTVAQAIASFLNGLPLADPDPSLNVQVST